MTTSEAGTSRIVVAVDGSKVSKQALAWALHQAWLTGATIDAVIAWHPIVGSAFAPPADFDVEGTARQVLDDTLDEVLAGEKAVPVRRHVVEGPAGQVLVNAARDAHLLVVGNRGHAGLTEALLGSVGQYCVHHSECPVVVVR